MKKIAVYFLLFGLCACAGTAERRLDSVRSDFESGNYCAGVCDAPKNNLELLLAGDALFQENKFSESDNAFETLRRQSDAPAAGSFLREAGGILGGQMANDYKPFMMDFLFVSYYQIWDALADGRVADARVIINQSYAAQQKMSYEYKNLIKDNKEQLTADKALSAKLKSEAQIRNNNWNAFTDIMNPALMYLSGIYFLNTGDFSNARTYLERAVGMVPANDFIKQDLAAANNGGAPNGVAWVFIESGFAPKLSESRFDMPVLGARGMMVVSIATSFATPLRAPAAIDGARLLMDTDAAFMCEYNEYKTNEIIRAVANATAKTIAQGVVSNFDNPYIGIIGGLATSIYSVATSNAEVRTWATLPKRISILRIEKRAQSTGNRAQVTDNESLIYIKSGDNILSEIKVPSAGNHLIYIRWLGNKIEPKIINLTKGN